MTHHRFVILFLAFLGGTISYLDRALLAFAIGPIESKFGLSNLQFGTILGAFGIGYIFSTAIGGFICDRYGTRVTWATGAILWSCVAALSALSSSFTGLFLGRLGLGLCEGVTYLSICRSMGNWFPSATRMSSTSLAIISFPFANAVASFAFPQMIETISWQSTYLFLALFGLVWAIAWLLLSNDYPRHSRFVNQVELDYIHGQPVDRSIPGTDLRYEEAHHYALRGGVFRYLFTNPSILSNYWCAFCQGYLVFFVLMWLPGYLEQTFPTGTDHPNLWYLAAPWILSLLLMLGNGVLSDAVRRWTGSIFLARTLLIAVGMLLGAIFLFFPSRGLSEGTTVLLITLGTGFVVGSHTLAYALNIELAPGRVASTAGFWDSFFAVGAAVAPSLTGLVATNEESFGHAFVILSAILASSTLLLLLFQRPPSRSPFEI